MATKRPMKGEKCDDIFTLEYPVYASPKIDGLRCVIEYEMAKSNSMKPLPNLHLQECLEDPWFNGLDGELTVTEPTDPLCYKKAESAVMTSDGRPHFIYHVFDICHDYLTDHKISYKTRLELLRSAQDKMIKKGADRGIEIRLVEQTLIHTPEGLEAYEAACLAKGYEGVMVRKPDSPYKYGRATKKQAYILKLKRYVDSEFVLVDILPSKENTNEKTIDAQGYAVRSTVKDGLIERERVGSFVVKDLKTGVTFSIGTFENVTHTELEQWWQNRYEMIEAGLTGVYKHFPVGGYDKPRHPVFKGWRNSIDMTNY